MCRKDRELIINEKKTAISPIENGMRAAKVAE